MHGRRLALLAPLALIALLAAPAAQADETLGLGQPSAVDGVVTSWRIQTVTPQTVQLRSTQTLMSGTATTATSNPVAAGTSPLTQAVAARLPIAAGGKLQLLDAIGSPTVDATVEPDRDGDGYGDTSQDPCPSDFTDHQAPCGGTTTFGSPLTLAPDAGLSSSGGVVQALQQSASGTTPTIAVAGILTRWRLRADPAKADTVIQLLRPTSGGGFVVAAESPVIDVDDTGTVALPTSIAVLPGDRLGVRSVQRGSIKDLGAIAARPGDELISNDPPKTLGQTWTPNAGTTYDYRLLVQADVEPDADGDGKGDVTQDSADVQVTGSAPAAVEATQSWSHSYTIRNAGPDAALDVRVEIRPDFEPSHLAPGGSGPGGMTCTSLPGPAGTGVSCTTPKLAPGASIALTASFPGPAISARSSSVSIVALAPDPDTTNNSTSLATTIRPYVPNLPPQQLPSAPACSHVIKGTRDDDVLRGTVFGDRLVGSDGGDLLKGLGGDDCLEGGAGADVLDAGDGNDRLAGASGKDRLSGGTGDDKLTGGAGNDRLSGGPGKDIMSPGSGRDGIAAGAGDDTINSVDGVRETVDCGAGKDTVRADRRDRLKRCEKITRRN